MRFWLRGPKESLCTPRDRAGGKGSLSRRDAVAKLPIWGLTCGYFRDLWTEKSKLASMLVIWSPRGPRVPMAWGGCASAAGYPIGCQIGSLARHETPLRWRDVRKPPKFRDQIVPAEISGPLRLELPAAKTSSYRIRQILGGCPRPSPRVPQDYANVLVATRTVAAATEKGQDYRQDYRSFTSPG